MILTAFVLACVAFSFCVVLLAVIFAVARKVRPYVSLLSAFAPADTSDGDTGSTTP